MSKWLCAESLPISIVDSQYFREFVAFLEPSYEVASRKTVTSYISDMAKESKENTCEDLKKVDYVSITTDGGSSSNAVSYLDVNVHYVDPEKFTLESKVLAVHQNVEVGCTAEDYRESTMDVVDEFELREKLVAVVTDNEAKMKKAFPDEIRKCT